MYTNDEIRAKDVLPQLTDFRDDTDGFYGDGSQSSFFMKALDLVKSILGRIHLLPTAITSFRTGDVIAVDGPSGAAKMSKDTLLELTAQNALGSIKSLASTKYKGFMALDDADGTGKMDVDTIFNNFAPKFVPNSTTTVVGQPYMYNGSLYKAKEDGYQGAWEESKFELVDVGEFSVPRDSSMLIPGVTVLASKDDSNFAWAEGICQRTDGGVVSNSNFKYNTVLIPVNSNTAYKLGHREPAERIYFYDENGIFISASDEAGPGGRAYLEFTTPEKCKFIRYSYYTGSSDGSVLKWNAGFSSKNIESALADRVAKDSSMLTSAKTFASKDMDLGWANGRCGSTNGAITSTSSYKYNETLIPVYPGATYKLGHRETSERIYFYDADGNFVSASDAPGSVVASLEFTVPEGCHYIRYSYYTGSSDGSVLKWNAGFSSSRVESGLGSKVAKDSTMFSKDEILADIYNTDLGWAEGICQRTDGGVTSNSNFKYNTVLIPVFPNAKYSVGVHEPAERIYFYDADGNFISASDEAGSRVQEFIFTTPNKCKFVRYSFYILNPQGSILRWKEGFSCERIEKFAEQIQGAKDYPILACPEIYDRVVGDGQKCETRVYAEGFVYGEALPVKINGGTFASITKRGASAGSSSLVVSFGGEGLKTKSANLSIKRVNVTTGMSGKQFVLFIGESTTAAQEKDPVYNDYHEEWGAPSALQKFNIKDRADNIGYDVKTIGRLGNKDLTFTYKGNSYTNRSFNEGFAGWPSYAFSNWPCAAKLSNSTTRFGAVQMWYALGLATKTPYSASFYNVDTEDYTGTATQRDLITKTKFGKYKVDGSASLWNLVQHLGTQTSEGYPLFSDSGDYTGSASQIAELQSWCDALAAEPINPFFDLSYARDNAKDTAFSLDAYLARYRTMDDLGVRLTGDAGESVTGSDGLTYTIGTKVTSTSDYDVCTPTLIIFNVGINDTEYNAGAESICDSIKALLNSTSVECGWYITRYPGALIPSLWRNCNIRQSALLAIYGQYTSMVFEWLATQSNKTAIPALFIQPPNSARGEYMSASFDDGDIVNASIDEVHAGINAYRAIGWNLLNWIYSL